MKRFIINNRTGKLLCLQFRVKGLFSAYFPKYGGFPTKNDYYGLFVHELQTISGLLKGISDILLRDYTDLDRLFFDFKAEFDE